MSNFLACRVSFIAKNVSYINNDDGDESVTTIKFFRIFKHVC